MNSISHALSLFIFAIIAFSQTRAQAAVQIPQRLSKADRITALRILGLGTSSKILTDPYPLGGYAGFEAGYSVENLPAEDLGRLGSGLNKPRQDVTIQKLTIGKGLYNNLDLFFQFTPYTKTDELAQYGGILRWSFYQASTLPLSASVLTHANSADFNNQMTTHSYGVDMIGGVNVEHLALFAGIGLAEATGTFTGGQAGITDTQAIESEIVSGVHTVVGADIRFSNVFVALQIDRYTLPVFSGKLGARF